ncbi:MAG: HNH endonuclease [Symploca sp. SIO1C4]|uniref:HNH endonuclease n=1 Tax=Symploca sp. SIO1C4 TaxID=2607765 RepID=A0A6B3NL16_9CYAN|nr:HNH endonuclease [Symploca sp. SIO1C4]
MPMERWRYPDNWEEIALEVKNAARWCCRRCGKQCLQPGESKEGLTPSDRARLTLTVHHANYLPEDNRLENLVPLCAPCHLLAHAGKKKNASPGQLSLW